MGSTTINPLKLASFNGSSQFAGDLQNAINHAVNVAGIPLTQLENNLTDLGNQQGELSTLQANFSAIQTALQKLSIASSGGLAASNSDNTIATVAFDSSSATGSGTYTLNVLSAGAQTLTLSNAGTTVTDPSTTSLSTAGSFTLSVNGVNTTITPSANTLSSLAQAINGSGAGVNATIVNLGSPTAPDYRLSIQGTSLNDDAIQLTDGTTTFLQTLTHGSQATYQIDGQPAPPALPISTTSSRVTLAPGLTVNLLQAGETTITVAPDPSAAENALSAFASAYNAAVKELGLNHGKGGGALTGQPIVSQLEQSLRSLVQYSGGSGTIHSLTDIGLSFDSTGNLTFDSTKFESAQTSDPGGVSSFLGATSTSGSGTGFLGTINSALTALEDPINGLFKTTNDNYQTQINKDSSQVNTIEARITTMQAALVQQMSLADAALSTLESQLTMITGLFSATRDAINNSH